MEEIWMHIAGKSIPLSSSLTVTQELKRFGLGFNIFTVHISTQTFTVNRTHAHVESLQLENTALDN